MRINTDILLNPFIKIAQKKEMHVPSFQADLLEVTQT